MPRFTTRVQLVEVVPENYEILHEEMEKSNFTRTIKAEKNKEYHLPHAEYNFDSLTTLDAEEVLKLAKKAAQIAIDLMSEEPLTEDEIDKSFRILVTKVDDNRRFHNLDLVD